MCWRDTSAQLTRLFQELEKQKNRLGTSDSTLNLHYLFLRGESGGASILQI